MVSWYNPLIHFLFQRLEDWGLLLLWEVRSCYSPRESSLTTATSMAIVWQMVANMPPSKACSRSSSPTFTLVHDRLVLASEPRAVAGSVPLVVIVVRAVTVWVARAATQTFHLQRPWEGSRRTNTSSRWPRTAARIIQPAIGTVSGKSYWRIHTH